MDRNRSRKALALAGALAAYAAPAIADEASGKVVWFDTKHSSLLLECPDKGCPAIPNAKTGETYTFVIPERLRKEVAALKEGDVVKVVYEDAKDKGYVVSAVSR